MCVPAQKEDFEWSVKSVKQLTGTGSIYIRLTTDHFLSSGGSDDSDGEKDVKICKIEKGEVLLNGLAFHSRLGEYKLA